MWFAKENASKENNESLAHKTNAENEKKQFYSASGGQVVNHGYS